MHQKLARAARKRRDDFREAVHYELFAAAGEVTVTRL
jgi:hypothetical protein